MARLEKCSNRYCEVPGGTSKMGSRNGDADNLTRNQVPHENPVPNPFQVADTFTEKVIVGTLLAVKYVNYFNPLFWPFLAAGCGGGRAQESTSGCTKDTDCREPRICKEGECVDPMPRMDAGSIPTRNPCEGIDCEGHGRCAVTEEGAALCFCNEGYKKSEDNPLACVMEARSQCLDERTASMLLVSGEYYTAECGPGSRCENGACRTIPGQQDPNCVTNLKSSNCRVTDVFDVGEDNDSRFQFETGHSLESENCGDDRSRLVGRHAAIGASSYGPDLREVITNLWLAATLFILSPPRASYYRLDAKLSCARQDFTTGLNGNDVHNFIGSNCNPSQDVSFKIFLGDDQVKHYEVDEDFEPCVFQPIGVFSTAGITTNSVRINIRSVLPNQITCDSRLRRCEHATYNLTAVNFAKLRVWSCSCD